jgi:2'-5' RNA ligase
MEPSQRLFVGLSLPGELQETLTSLDPRLRGLRWLPSGQMHLTMSFLGEVAAERIAGLKETLGGVHVPAFFLPVQGLGSFNSRGKPSVVWAGVGRGHPHLFALHKHLQDAVLQAGLEPDLRPFHPHITVARARDLSKQALQPFLRRHAEAEFGMFKVAGFTLYSSALAPEGATHTPELDVTF